MEKSKVYYTDMRVKPGDSLPEKLKRLLRAAGLADMELDKKFVAIKLHFGEPGNLAFLRPNFARAVADIVKEKGGRPFLTDCSTLYVGKRKHALEHLDSAAENGFSYDSTGCRIVIGDGLRGNDEKLVPVPGGELVKEAKIGSAIMEADVLISLAHFKGHEATGFGGALKNIGMGCASTGGKMEQHSSGKPVVIAKRCKSCKKCAKQCAHDAIGPDENRKAHIDHEKCVGCGRCIGACNYGAIFCPQDSSLRDLNIKMAEYSAAVLNGREAFHINIVMDVSPLCDCYGGNDTPIIPNVGMFASFDPVAIDQACAEACNKMPALKNSALGDIEEDNHGHHSHDIFTHVNPDTDWSVCLEHSEKLGLGKREYELIEVK